MRASSARRLAIGAAIGSASLAAGLYAAILQNDDTVLLAGIPIQIVPIPADLLPAGVRPPPPPQALTPTQRADIAAALWREPLDQSLVNLLYVDAMISSGRNARTVRFARTLSRLGWRSNPAQQNLMLRAALDQRFGEVVDRADALLRRQKLADQASAMLIAMEAIPQVNDVVVRKLVANPMWRHTYLMRVGPEMPGPVLDARTRTMATLLRRPDTITRGEMSPILAALVATGRGSAAYRLWTLKAGPTPAGNLLRDPRFRTAAAVVGDDTPIPFEWKTSQNLGYSVDVDPQGIVINWDGRGVPAFVSQLVPVTSGAAYRLAIKGRADGGKLGDLVTPMLTCGSGSNTFAPVAAVGDVTRFRSAVLPKGCDMAVLSLTGSVDTAARPTTIDIRQIALQRV